MDIIEAEIERAARSELRSVAIAGTVGIVLLLHAAADGIGYRLSVNSFFSIYGPALLAIFGAWYPFLKWTSKEKE